MREIPWLLFAVAFAFPLAPSLPAQWQKSAPGWEYVFPRDESAHPDFKTEWWYFTGNLREDSTGRRFGYQLTFFRQGIRPPGQRPPAKSAFVTDHFWFAHFAISDLEARKFHATETISRGVFGEAGSGGGDDRLVWIGDWTLRQPKPGSYALSATNQDMAIQLGLTSKKPPVFHGEDGISAKSPDAGNASHYFSHTRLDSKGSLRLGSRSFTVQGTSWFDREWSTSVLGQGVSGWDWFSIHLDQNVEVMLFQLRRTDGSSAFTSGTLIESDGTTRRLKHGEIRFTAGKIWKNAQTGVSYPIDWRAEIPSMGLSLRVKAAIPNQELQLSSVSYWEGSTIVEGTRNGHPTSGFGYLEMTGYGSTLAALR